MKKRYKILFIQPIASFSGSLKSSEEYIKNLYKKFDFIFLTQNGYSQKILKKYGKVFSTYGICKFDNTKNSHYVGLRWFLILREILYFFFTFIKLLKIKLLNHEINLIHMNEITGLPTAIIAKLIFQKPLIIHARTLNYKNNKSLVSKLYLKMLSKFADKILAIDKDVFNTIHIRKKTLVLRNILDLNFNFKKRKISKNEILNVGYIGTFLKYKGVEILIRATEELILRGYKIRLILAGSPIKRGFFLDRIFNILNVENNINPKFLKKKFIKNLGFVKNIKNFYSKIDILCFPSSLNATGRQIFEAGMFSIPVIVCMKSSKNDGVKNNHNGLIYNNFHSTKELQKRILKFYYNRNLIKIMGNKGKKIALQRNTKNYNINKLISIYNNLINNS